MRNHGATNVQSPRVFPPFFEMRKCSVHFFNEIPDAKPVPTFAGIALVEKPEACRRDAGLAVLAIDGELDEIHRGLIGQRLRHHAYHAVDA